MDKTSAISYVVETRSNIELPAISLVGLNTEDGTFGIALGMPAAVTANDASSIPIIKRVDWGADETLRYGDNPIWKNIYAKIEANKDKPKSDATLKYEAKIQSIRTHLATLFPEQDKAIETIRNEGSHSLAWPIEKTKQVERIVIHHTAENNQSNRDDLSLIRGIYYYHTIVRGW